MILERVVIQNLFSYYGVQEFDLSGIEPGKNIVLISGRNGFGKTNFLRCIKLLFAGASDDLRNAVQRGQKYSRKQYIQGKPGTDWSGVLNRIAQSRGVTTCAVTLVWSEPEKGRITATRRFYLTQQNTEDLEELIINAPFVSNVPLSGDDASQFLEHYLPPKYLPFFFFDGEEIQALAEANSDEKLELIERLLHVTPLIKLEDTVNDVYRRWRQQALADSETREKLDKKQDERNELVRKIATEQERYAELERQIEDHDTALVATTRQFDEMRTNTEHGQRLQQELLGLEKEITDEQKALAEALCSHAPLLFNPDLAQRAHSALQLTPEHIQADLILRLARDLPRDLFEEDAGPPLPLSTAQQLYYKRRLEDLIRRRAPATPATIFSDTDLSRRVDADTQLAKLLPVSDLRAERVRRIRLFLEKRQRRFEIRAALDDRPPDEHRRYVELQQRIAEQNQELGRLREQRQRAEFTMKSLTTQRTTVDSEIVTYEQEALRQGGLDRRLQLAQNIQSFLHDYRQQAIERLRTRIEQRINDNFQRLRVGPNIVRRIGIREGFEMDYYDAEGRLIHMGLLSAGTKQLTATALLWAMHDLSTNDIPVVIDTPLARIDRENQLNLLSEYYPNAGSQVIILPTNSEIDNEKYRLLKPYVYREYRLCSEKGDRSWPEPGSMYPS